MVEEERVECLRQDGSGVRFDWGPTGAEVLVAGAGAGAVVVIDVLSFTTAVSIATGRGIAVAPYPLAGPGAVELASRIGASLAVPRRELSPEHPWSLSPSALLTAPHTERLVLPSPNGSAVAASVAAARPGWSEGGSSSETAIMAGCLRNVTATANWLLARGYGSEERPVWLIGAGERWPDGSLRPALEDLFGAGALAGALFDAGCDLSPEAQAAARTFAVTPDLAAAISGCASGRELVTMGFPHEATIAAALDADGHASVMDDGLFVAA